MIMIFEQFSLIENKIKVSSVDFFFYLCNGIPQEFKEIIKTCQKQTWNWSWADEKYVIIQIICNLFDVMSFNFNYF